MSSGTHSYYDWQVSTLLLAYDVTEPLARKDVESLGKRQQAVELELHEMAQRVLPREYFENPQAEFPPEIVMAMTKATLKRAAIITGLLPKEG